MKTFKVGDKIRVFVDDRLEDVYIPEDMFKQNEKVIGYIKRPASFDYGFKDAVVYEVEIFYDGKFDTVDLADYMMEKIN